MAVVSDFMEKWAANKMLKGQEITLNYKRVFILPTKAGIVFVLLLIIILLLGINYQSNLVYGLCFTLGSILFITIIHTCRNLANTIIANAGAAPVFAGEAASFRLHLESKKGAHQAIGVTWASFKGKELQEELQLIDVTKQTGADLLLIKEAPKRGIFYPGRIYIQTQFPLGLFVSWTEVDLFLKVIVYPKPIAGVISPSGYAGEEEDGAVSLGRGVDDFQGLRSYQPGDSMRFINWKSFSKEQGLFVKDFSSLVGQDVWLDFALVEGSIDHKLSVLCYWVLKMSQEQHPFGLKLPNIELPPDIGEKHQQEALYALAMYGITK